MNRFYYHYIREVLGVSQVLKPVKQRSLYRLHYRDGLSPSHQSSVLFVCFDLSSEGKHLIYKMNEALGQVSELVLEFFQIPDEQEDASDIAKVFRNILLRFSPRIVVWFGLPMARQVLKDSCVYGRNAYQISTGLTTKQVVPIVILEPIEDFLQGPKEKVAVKKQNAWKELQAVKS